MTPATASSPHTRVTMNAVRPPRTATTTTAIAATAPAVTHCASASYSSCRLWRQRIASTCRRSDRAGDSGDVTLPVKYPCRPSVNAVG